MRILLIEDDADDIELLQEALKNHAIAFEMDVIKDGKMALDHFRSSSVAPEIIILDLNLPKVHGRELIVEIKTVQTFKDIPLLILTTSSAKEDIEYSYKHGADKYLIKPSTIEKIRETVSIIVQLSSKSPVEGK
jgi:DNA-binding response OmpR family regulator